MFDKAVHILSYDVCEGDKYHMHDFKKVGFLLDLAKYAGSFLIIYKIITLYLLIEGKKRKCIYSYV